MPLSITATPMPAPVKPAFHADATPVAAFVKSSITFMGWSMVTDATSGSSSKAASALTGIVNARALDHVQRRMQATRPGPASSRSATASRDLLVLHDDPDGLALRRSLLGFRHAS